MKMKAVAALLVAAALVIAVISIGARAGSDSRYPELGEVRWNRSLETPELQVKVPGNTGAPVFILFQEVPEYATCVSYGKEVLSYPLMADLE